MIDDSHLNRGYFLSTLGTCLQDRFTLTGDHAALAEAVDVGRAAVVATLAAQRSWGILVTR